MKNRRVVRYALSILSGILLSLSFPYTGSCTVLIFIAWIPLLFIEQTVFEQKYRPSIVFIHAFITFLLYNIGTTWWIALADIYGAMMAFVLNALLMASSIQIFHCIKRKTGREIGSLAFIVTWIGFEFLHYHWELSHPWLTMGNVFSIKTTWVQWYEYTGVLGGSLWILVVNLLLLRTLKTMLEAKKMQSINRKRIALPFVVLLTPLVISLWIYQKQEETGIQTEVVIVQPNIDPYQKFSSIHPFDQIQRIVDLAETKRSINTKIVLAPETAMPVSFDETQIDNDWGYRLLNDRVKSWKTTCLLIGAATERRFDTRISRASKWDELMGKYIEYYNSSVLITQQATPEIVHKSKLVLGAEKIPFSHWFSFMEQWSVDLGGTTGTLGTEPTPKNCVAGQFPFTPSICYESIYGQFTAQQTKLGSQAIFIITNDGWWGDTPGYKQHFSFARLRAIENRKSVARSANTGTSGFINQRGDVLKSSLWWKQQVLNGKIFRNDKKTVYMLIGDAIGKLALITAVLLVILALLRSTRFGRSKK